jgi:putative alpha-1,2-mannosidase
VLTLEGGQLVVGAATYRSPAPLQTTLYPGRAGDMAHSLLRDAQWQGGWWPTWPPQNMTGDVMNGDNGVPLFAQDVAFCARGVDLASGVCQFNG